MKRLLIAALCVAGIASAASSVGTHKARAATARSMTPLSTGARASAPAFQVLHGFSGGPGGASPNALIQGKDGFFYGSTANGGDVTSCPSDGCGTLFKMDGAGNLNVLHVFHATDGYLPQGGLIQAKDGYIYGTASAGGQPSGGGGGVLFRIDTAGTMTVLYRFVGGFACCDGGGPDGPPIEASDGNFYGVTGAGGAFRDIDHQGGFGTVYRYDPGTGALTVLHSFNLADGNGIYPNGPLVQGADGFLYGTTSEGGGGVFRIDTAGNFALLHRITDSGEPLAGLIRATDGSFYGTTNGPPGTVFRIDSAGNYTVVNRFDGGDGYGLNQMLMQAGDGVFYGTAPQGGLLDFQGGDIFRLDATGKLSVLHSFDTTNPAGGYIPGSQLIQGADGALYGTTGLGGPGLRGTVFRLDQRIPGPVATLTVQPPTVNAGDSAVGTVTLSSPAPTGGTTVVLRAGSFQVTVPATVTVPAGARTATFTIQTATVGSNGEVRLYGSVAGQGIRTTFTILPPSPLPRLSALTLSPSSVRGGRTSTGTVRLTSPAPPAGAVVTLASSSTKAIVPPSVKVPGGATGATFIVRTRLVTKTTPATISATYNGDTKNANLAITP